MPPKKKKTKEEREAEARKRAEARGLKFVPEEEARARAVPGVFPGPGGRPGGITLPGGRTFTGLSPDEVAAIQQREGLGAGAGAEGFGIVREAEKARRLKEGAAPVLEEAGAFEEVTPRERELEPLVETPDVPIVGPAVAGAITSILRSEALRGFIEKQFPDVAGAGEGFPELSDETIREAALREIREKSFKEGLSLSQTFGSFIETIPIGAVPLIGGQLQSYVRDLIEDPSQNVETALAEINKIKEAASTGQEKVRNGLEDPDYGLDRARSMEEDIAHLTGRIKLLISTSATLRANMDGINLIQEAILEAEEKVARYRQASAFGFTAQMTGTGRPIPTDEQIFFELKEGR